jgi:hypothetical protein
MNWFNSTNLTIVKILKRTFAAIINKCTRLFGLLLNTHCSFSWSSSTSLAVNIKYLIVLSF